MFVDIFFFLTIFYLLFVFVYVYNMLSAPNYVIGCIPRVKPLTGSSKLKVILSYTAAFGRVQINHLSSEREQTIFFPNVFVFLRHRCNPVNGKEK